MLGLVFDPQKKCLGLEEVNKPVCGDDDIILKVKACGICGGDRHLYSGGFVSPKATGKFVVGHEFSGVIAEKGKNVSDKWQIGDRVMTENTGKVCGKCYACSLGHYGNCNNRYTIGMATGFDGGFTSYARIPGDIVKIHPNCLFHFSENISFEEATVLEPAANGYRMIAHVRAGETVVIYGAGVLGLSCVQFAALAGAAKIIILDLTRKGAQKVRVKLAKELGATHYVSNDDPSTVPGEIQKIVGDYYVDHVIDTTGMPEILMQAIDIVKNEGTVIRAGINGREIPCSMNRVTLKGIKLIGHHAFTTTSWINSIRLAEEGKLPLLPKIITHVLPLSQWEDGFKAIGNGEAAKVVLIPEDD